jgi:hypothetical protein
MSRLELSRSMEEAIDRYDVMDAVRDELQKKGIVIPPAPQWKGSPYDGQLPSNLADFSEHDLSEMLTVTTQWKNFLRGQVSLYKGARESVKKQVRVIKAYLRKQFREVPEVILGNTCDAQWAVDDRVERDDHYFSNLVEILHAAYDAAESDYAAVSRIVAVRGQERDGTRRARNVQFRHGGLE